MKKNKLFKSICLALALSTLCMVGVGCKKKKADTDSSVTEEVAGGTYVLNDFSTATHLYQIFPSVSYSFGKASFNTDEKYTSSKNGSAKLEPNFNMSSEAVVKQRLISKSLGYNYADLHKVSKIEAKIYNDTDTPLTVAAEIQFSDNSKTPREKTVLAPKAWTTVTYKVFPALLSMRFKLDKGLYVNYYFEKNGAVSNPVLYMDDITITYTDVEAEPIDMTVAENEFCSFDKNYQSMVCYLSGWDNYNAAVPEMGLSADPTYTVNGTGNSYKIRTVKGTSRWSHWYYLKFSPAYCKQAKLNEVKAGDKFQFSVYNQGPTDAFQFNFYSVIKTDAGEETITFGWDFFLEERPMVNSNEWTTFELDFATLEERGKAYVLQKYKVENYDVLGHLASIDFTWGEFVDCAEKTFYLDEIKFIRGNA